MAASKLDSPCMKTDFFQLARDPRFSYALFVPDGLASQPTGLLVAVHSSQRNYEECRDRFSVYARGRGLVVLAPHFPCGLAGDEEGEGYKLLAHGPLRYDLVLNDMVREVQARTGCDADRFLLYGYSGGAQFALRYLFVHPRRVQAACVASPGEITTFETQMDWACGIGNFESTFGGPLDATALRQVPLQLAVGDQDVDTDELKEALASRYWESEVQRRCAHRIARLKIFHRSCMDFGLDVQLSLMPGVRHGDGCPPSVAIAQRFFDRVLSAG